MTEYQLATSELTLPRAIAPATSRPDQTPARKCSILLIENQLDTVAAVFAALDPAAHQIEVVSVDSAVAAFVDDRAVDLILLSLSNADGVRTLIELKRGTDTPVVALVGGRDYFQLTYQLRMATAAGANGVVAKPLAAERLRVVLDQALRAATPDPTGRPTD